MSGPWVLGLAASHNGAACLLRGREIAAAVQEERLTRQKRAALRPAEPFRALDYVLEAAGIGPDALDRVVVCPLRSAADPGCDLARHPTLAKRPRAVISHHRAHALGAYAVSGFEEAAVLVVDGMGSEHSQLDAGERAALVGPEVGRETASIYRARGDELWPLEKHLGVIEPPALRPGQPLPALMGFCSLGTMYQSVAQRIFGGWFDAGKVMGLAPYGRPRWPVEAFLRWQGARLVFADRLLEEYSVRARWPAHEEVHRDLACSVQAACEEGMLHLARRAAELTGSRRLCLAGGVALNGPANERIIRSGLFEEVFIIPAAEDSGTALGAAVEGLGQLEGGLRLPRLTRDALGRPSEEACLEAALNDVLAGSRARVDRPRDIAEATARLLAEGRSVGWFQGRSELGPRALGQRSILLDPRRPDGKDHLNRQVKHREPFRPFAPAVLVSRARAWFDLGPADESPFMLRVVPVLPDRRAAIPAVVHVDGTARVQTVAEDGSPFHRLIEAFEARTGVPIVLNTSFNVAGEPLVETPADALRCFLGTGLEACAVGPWLVR